MIFETIETKVDGVNRKLLSFKDCPNKCKEGKLFDMYTHTEKLCDFCAEKRRRMVQEGLQDDEYGSIVKILHLPQTFRGYTLKADDFFSNFEDGLNTYTEESVEQAKTDIDTLLQNISAGNAPNYSMAIQLPHLFNEYDFIATLLIRSYIAGFNTAPMVTSIDLVNLRREYENGKTEREDELTYEYYLKADTVVIYIDNAVTSAGLNAVYGFTNLRSTRYKPTILVAKTRILKKDNFSLNPDYKFYKIIELEKKSNYQIRQQEEQKMRQKILQEEQDKKNKFKQASVTGRHNNTKNNTF